MGSRQVVQAPGTATLANQAMYVPVSRGEREYLVSLQEIPPSTNYTRSASELVLSPSDSFAFQRSHVAGSIFRYLRKVSQT